MRKPIITGNWKMNKTPKEDVYKRQIITVDFIIYIVKSGFSWYTYK